MVRPQAANAEAGYTLIEVIAVITIVMILSGAALGMMRSGSSSAARFRYLFHTQTQLTRVIKEISYGYGATQGAAGASTVKKQNDGSLRIDEVEYYKDGGRLKRKRAGKEVVVLTGVESFSAEVEGKVLMVTITTGGRQSLSVTQRVFLRGITDAT